MGPQEVACSYLVPEMIRWKFHENRTLGSVKTKLRPLTLNSWVKEPGPFGGRRWVGDRDDMGQKTVREEIGMDLGGTKHQRTSKSTHSKIPILFRCSSNPDDRRPSGFKIHFIAAKLQPPAQNLQIKVKKVKSLEWKEETLEIARHQKLQTRSNNAINWYYVDTVKV